LIHFILYGQFYDTTGFVFVYHHSDEGRWKCSQLMHNETFVPTEDNANKIETWKHTYGHHPNYCNGPYSKYGHFKMGQCAVNCHIQWFAGLTCKNASMAQQYEVAKAKLLRYNFIIITDKLRDPEYVAATESFFGVPGLTEKNKEPWCGGESHSANEKVPLVIKNETLQSLTRLNKLDIDLYHEMKDCLDDGVFDFPAWDPNRFIGQQS
jgi:hypothetical protein